MARPDTDYGPDLTGVTPYTWPGKYYFEAVLRESFRMANPQKNPRVRMLDFGCGLGRLKKIYPDYAIIGFDAIPELSEVEDWREVKFSVLVANHVFYSMDKLELEGLRDELYAAGRAIVFSDSRGTLLNKLLANLARRPLALSRRINSLESTLSILTEKFFVEKEKSVWGLSRVYRLEPLSSNGRESRGAEN